MRNMKYNKSTLSSIVVIGLFYSFQSSSVAANNKSSYDALVAEISVCQSMPNDTLRLNCFDKLSVDDGNDASELKAQSTSTEIPENLGKPKIYDGSNSLPSYRGVVKSCQKSHDGKWFFIFENNQVWKQVDRVKRRYKACNFNVSIVKGSFGYKLLIDDDPRPIRIKRHR